MELNSKLLQSTGGYSTAHEIAGQPKLWMKTLDLFLCRRSGIQDFLQQINAHPDIEVILTGAGTSAFIGDVLQGPFQKNTGNRTRAVATTDLVSHPENYFHTHTPTLLVSFARSGNSPESVASVELANNICKICYHLIITCNPEGKLASMSQQKSYVFMMPPEANDQSLAMTGSFTSMLLAGLLISRVEDSENIKNQVDLAVAYANTILDTYATELKEVANLDFKRAIFLGSGPLLGTALESHLKLLELTDGIVVCKHDSYLGFRHGPKAIIDDTTLLVYLLSNNAYVQQYEADLIAAVNAGQWGMYSIGISEVLPENVHVDLSIVLSTDKSGIEEEFLAVCSVLPAQILGFYKSLQLGLSPDNPSVNGKISRVVKGVNIYPYHLRNENHPK